MATRNFRELAARAKESWSEEAAVVYNAAAASYEAEVVARHDLGAMLAAARAERHLTQPSLARLSGIQQAEISRIETGRGNPTFTTLNRLANALGARFILTEATEHGSKASQAPSGEQKEPVVPTNTQLTTQQAADHLGISRPTLVKLLEQGDIPFSKVGRHRRVLLTDLVAYEEDLIRHRRTCLREATREAAANSSYFQVPADTATR